MAFCADVDAATVYARPQIGSVAAGTLTASKTPSLATCTDIWGKQSSRVSMCLAVAGIDPSTVTASSVLESWACDLEARLTSGFVLLAKAQIGDEGLEQAQALIARGESDLAELKPGSPSFKRLRSALLSQGGSALSVPVSGRVGSNWTRGAGRHEGDDATTDHDEPAPIFPDPPGETAL